MVSPMTIVVGVAMGLGLLATAFMLLAVMTNGWQEMTWNTAFLLKYTSNDTSLGYRVEVSKQGDYYIVLERNTDTDNETRAWKQMSIVFSMDVGVWNMCDRLSDASRAILNKHSRCYSFITEYNEENTLFQENAKWIARMHNSAASCFIVSLIDLVAGVITGVIGIAQRQVSVCMVTGVLYVLAGLFGVFGLSIFHTKDHSERHECFSIEPIPQDLCAGRVINIAWSLPLAWMAVVFAVFACIVWLFLARLLRVIKSRTML